LLLTSFKSFREIVPPEGQETTSRTLLLQWGLQPSRTRTFRDKGILGRYGIRNKLVEIIAVNSGAEAPRLKNCLMAKTTY